MTEEVLDQQQEQQIDDFVAGFDGVDATPTETPETQQPAEPAPESPQYAQITVAELEQLRQSATLVNEIKAAQEKQLGTAFGKIGGIERTLNELKSGGSGLQISDEDFAELRAEYPELADLQLKGLQKALSRAGTQKPADIEALLQERIRPELENVATYVERKTEEKLLTREHRDWREVIGLPDPSTGQIPNTEYRQWLATQPQDYQQKVNNAWDSDVIGESLSNFKKARDKAAQDAKRKQRMADAVPVHGDGGHGTSSGKDPFEEGFQSG